MMPGSASRATDMNETAKSNRYENEFDSKRVLVTGGTKGAGKAIANRFLQGGATVITAARSAPEQKTHAHFVQADISTSDGATKVINEIINRFRGVYDIIHNVAGSSSPTATFITATIHNLPPTLY